MTLRAPPSGPEELLSPPGLGKARPRSFNGSVLTSRSIVSLGSRFRQLNVLERLGKARHQIVGRPALDRKLRNVGRCGSIAGPLCRLLIVAARRGPTTELVRNRALVDH